MNRTAARRLSFGVAAVAFLLVVALIGINPWAPIASVDAGAVYQRIVNVDRYPIGVAVDSIRGDVWTINFAGTWSNGETDKGNFSRIDVDRGYIVDTFRDMRIGSPQGIAVNPQTGRGYITSELQVSPGVSRLWEFSLENGQLTRSIDLGQKGFGVAVDTQRNRIYVANQESSSVSVVDGNNMTEIARVGVTGFPAYIAVDQARGYVYVTSFNISDRSQQVVSKIDPNQNYAVVRTQQPPGEPYGVLVDPKDGSVYVTSNGNDQSWLTLYNPNFDWVFDKNYGVKSMFHIALNPNTRSFFITTGGEQYMMVLNNDTIETQRVDVQRTTRGIGVDPVTGLIFVAAPTCRDCGDTKLTDIVVYQDDQPPIGTPTPSVTPTPQAPILQLSTGEVAFVVQNGQQTDPRPQYIEISNIGSGTLSWQVLQPPDSDLSRFRISPARGVAAPNLPSRVLIEAVGPFTRTVDATIIVAGDAQDGTQRSPQTVRLRIAVADTVRHSYGPLVFRDTLALTVEEPVQPQGQAESEAVLVVGPTPDLSQPVDLTGAVPIDQLPPPAEEAPASTPAPTEAPASTPAATAVAPTNTPAPTEAPANTPASNDAAPTSTPEPTQTAQAPATTPSPTAANGSVTATPDGSTTPASGAATATPTASGTSTSAGGASPATASPSPTPRS